MKSNPILLLFFFVVFFTGLYVYVNGNLERFIEPMDQTTDGQNQATLDSSCPTLLIREGNSLVLYNPKQPQSDTNPLPFYNIDEYVNYVTIQRKKGVNCPILFLQKENDVQGNDVYRIRPGPDNLQGGLPTYVPILVNNVAEEIRNPVPVFDASRENGFNGGEYAGFDPTSLYVGRYTTLDQLHESTKQMGSASPNPADTNWGGVQYTQALVDSGAYAENNVFPPKLIEASKMR
jgi:hypothetical protein